MTEETKHACTHWNLRKSMEKFLNFPEPQVPDLWNTAVIYSLSFLVAITSHGSIFNKTMTTTKESKYNKFAFVKKVCPWKSSIKECCSVVSNSLWLHGLQHTRLPCPSLFPEVCSDSCPWSQWCHTTISTSVSYLGIGIIIPREQQSQEWLSGVLEPCHNH